MFKYGWNTLRHKIEGVNQMDNPDDISDVVENPDYIINVSPDFDEVHRVNEADDIEEIREDLKAKGLVVLMTGIVAIDQDIVDQIRLSLRERFNKINYSYAGGNNLAFFLKDPSEDVTLLSLNEVMKGHQESHPGIVYDVKDKRKV